MKNRKRTEWSESEKIAINNIRYIDDNLIHVTLPGTYGGHCYYSPTEYKVPKHRELIDRSICYWTERVDSCKAWLMYTSRYIFVISYNTVIGAFDEHTGIYYRAGAYSNTTYQHERKALRMMGVRYTDIVNLWLVDNFGD